ncbi:MAG: cold-shock protein [Candidatus Altiarchaeales archaeon]|nr:cold-shock protein [Candidatus Altiarchaeales archaeon]MBD3416465.1 cold-shock protein [Candidatus Altiarchaeales archaeon]
MVEGVVKFFNTEKNFGFITGDDGKDYFVHRSGIEGDNVIRDGDRVSFEVVEGERGPKAEKVQVI